MSRFRPTLTDNPACKIKFEAGDRVITHISQNVSASTAARLKRIINKFAKVDVNSLIVNCLDVTLIHIDIVSGRRNTLASPADAQTQDTNRRTININCSKVELKENDKLLVLVRKGASEFHKSSVRKVVKDWAGDDIEVLVQERPF